jgi:hypothetical protein
VRKFIIGFVALAALTTGLAFAADVGPKADVAAVRGASTQQFPSRHVDAVHVVGDYALLDWYDQESGGYALYKRTSGERWKQIDFSGGVTNVSLMAQHGVPTSIGQKLCVGWGDAKPCQL